jgi:ferrous iron transport protein B
MSKTINVGFIGNPNCGKTTLFNAFTGANLKVANWPGVTVEKKEGYTTYEGEQFKLVDLPGIYSLTSYTMEEKVSRECIMSDEIDVIVDVVDASCLERNLYLTLQLIELGKPVILALNMMDIVEERGMEIDLHRLPEMLGIPAIPVSARKKSGLSVLMHAVSHHADHAIQNPLIHHHHDKQSRHEHNHHTEYAMVYSDALEDKIDAIMDALSCSYPTLENPRWHAIKLLEKDESVTAAFPLPDLEKIIDRSYEQEIINQKYDFIEEIIQEILVNKSEKEAFTEKLDHFLTHRIWGLPLFLGIMALVFLLTFTVGDWLKGYFEIFLESFSAAVTSGLTSRHDDFPSCRWYHLRCRRNSDFPAKHFHPVSRACLFGRQRLHGSCRLRHG